MSEPNKELSACPFCGGAAHFQVTVAEGQIAEFKQRAEQADRRCAELREALQSIKPDPACPWCSPNGEPCAECLMMARLSGKFSRVISTTTPSTLQEKDRG